MLLVVDIGNTNIVFGVCDEKSIIDYWRIKSDLYKTADEYGFIFTEALRQVNTGIHEISGAIVASVVPSLTAIIKRMINRYFKIQPFIVDENTQSGLKICYDKPGDVGADRIVNAVSAFTLYGGPVIIVDFGTAITFCAVSSKAEYLGGVIVPGISISMDALTRNAAKLSGVPLEVPEFVIGRNTIASIQSGVIYGYAGLVDAIIDRMKMEMEGEPYVIATGGQAEVIVPHTRNIKEINPMLTLEGLRIILEKIREEE